MLEGKPDKSREDTRTPTGTEEASGRSDEILPAQKISESRRRFAKAGLLASPILMSVVSRPVIGGGVNCLSNALSGNMSNPNRGMCEVPTETEIWTDATTWPSGEVIPCASQEPISIVADSLNGTYPSNCQVFNDGNYTGGTLFNDVFCTSPLLDDLSMYEVLCNHSVTNPDEAAAVEMLLYSLKYPKYAVRPVQVQHLYEGRGPGGYYEAFLSHFGGLKGYLDHTLTDWSAI